MQNFIFDYFIHLFIILFHSNHIYALANNQKSNFCDEYAKLAICKLKNDLGNAIEEIDFLMNGLDNNALPQFTQTTTENPVNKWILMPTS